MTINKQGAEYVCTSFRTDIDDKFQENSHRNEGGSMYY